MLQKSSYSFENCDDNALVELFKNDEVLSAQAFEAICSRYLNLISSISSKYRFCAESYELSDFMQEGLIGLLSACKNFDENGGMSFKNYAMLCVENRFKTIMRHQSTKAQVPAKNLVPIDDSLLSLEDVNALSVSEVLESKEYIKSVFKKHDSSFSTLEKKVLRLYLSGYSYKQTACALSISEKSVDNALYRIKKKLNC